MDTAWPALVFGLIAIVILSGIAFTRREISEDNRPWIFAMGLITSMIWILLIYWFCATRHHTIAWFFLLIPATFLLTWAISYWLASTTTCPENVLNNKDVNWFIF